MGALGDGSNVANRTSQNDLPHIERRTTTTTTTTPTAAATTTTTTATAATVTATTATATATGIPTVCASDAHRQLVLAEMRHDRPSARPEKGIHDEKTAPASCHWRVRQGFDMDACGYIATSSECLACGRKQSRGGGWLAHSRHHARAHTRTYTQGTVHTHATYAVGTLSSMGLCVKA